MTVNDSPARVRREWDRGEVTPGEALERLARLGGPRSREVREAIEDEVEAGRAALGEGE